MFIHQGLAGDLSWLQMKGKGAFFLFCEITYSVIFQRVLRLVINSYGSLESSRICMSTIQKELKEILLGSKLLPLWK